jgi:cytochrome oxidase assembly protein ShyY1
VYRFLLTPRWLAAAALALTAAAVMVLLGDWQLHRYHERSAINHRIDAADSVRAVPMTSLLARPTATARAGTAPGKNVAWTKISVSGRYDPAHEIQARARTVNGDVGFEIVTPLILNDGTAVLIDRGWIPAPPGGAVAAPTVPPAPGGQVSVVGQVHLSESRPTPIAHRDGRLDTRRISVPRLAAELPYPVYGAYVLLTAQTPAGDPAFTEIPIDHEDSWQNAGYTVQWWLFAGMALFAFGWQARREASSSSGSAASGAASSEPASSSESVSSRAASGLTSLAASGAASSGSSLGASRWSRSRSGAGPRPKPTGDRVEESDRRAAASRAAAATPGGGPSAGDPE